MKIKFVPTEVKRDHDWLNLALGIPWTEDTKGIVALDEETNRPVAAALFNMWTENAVCCHWWIDNPLVIRHGFFEEACEYVFSVAKRGIMLGILPDEPESPSNKLAHHVGFTEVGRVKDGAALGVDQVIYELRVENAGKWYEVEYGKESTKAA